MVARMAIPGGLLNFGLDVFKKKLYEQQQKMCIQ